MNASVLALLHVMQVAGCTSRALQSLRSLCQASVRRGSTLMLASQLVVRSILRNWTFDQRQQDASEFTTILLNGLGLNSSVWAAKYSDVAGIHVPHTGELPLSLRLRAEACSLQGLLEDWSAQQGYVHALVAQEGPLLLHLVRNAEAVKSVVPVTLSAVVRVPFFVEGTSVEWRPFQVASIVEHHGDQVTCGHYRSLLKTSDGWLHSDDHSPAVPVLWSTEREKLIYLVWLVPARASAAVSASESSC